MITSLSNAKVKLVRGLQSRRSVRYREKLMVAEGTRLVQEALLAGRSPRFVFHTADWASTPVGLAMLESLAESAAPALLVSDKVMAGCTDTNTPQGILAVLPISHIIPPAAPTFVLVIDRLRIPGNLGTILRTAAAAGVELVLLPPGNIDPFNPKVVRGGMGAHFRLAILRPKWAEIRERLTELDIWLASAGEGVPHDQVDWSRPLALIVGGEASGAGEFATSLVAPSANSSCSRGQVHIPMSGGMESLNAAVATGVLLFEIARQRG